MGEWVCVGVGVGVCGCVWVCVLYYYYYKKKKTPINTNVKILFQLNTFTTPAQGQDRRVKLGHSLRDVI